MKDMRDGLIVEYQEAGNLLRAVRQGARTLFTLYGVLIGAILGFVYGNLDLDTRTYMSAATILLSFFFIKIHRQFTTESSYILERITTLESKLEAELYSRMPFLGHISELSLFLWSYCLVAIGFVIATFTYSIEAFHAEAFNIPWW